ncbi:DUF1439 domain-containing protein [Zobellella maritima]|uniref:DUF1439 domain-containing protein n=1 Tax=Zobellella maritima TaxID=2059725 RepID=UPI000E30836A|nr:DUF1439 domain-containing protein [Zobellella maritima]
MKIILFLIVFGISQLTQAQTLILTEQQLNERLNNSLDKEYPFTLGDWLNADIRLQQIAMTLGRPEADKVRISGKLWIQLAQPDTRYSWLLDGNFSARPRYDNQLGALFLDEFELLEYRLESSSQPKASMFMPYLLQGLAQYLSRYPVYVLDEADPLQARIKQRLVRLEVQPGRLLLQGSD